MLRRNFFSALTSLGLMKAPQPKTTIRNRLDSIRKELDELIHFAPEHYQDVVDSGMESVIHHVIYQENGKGTQDSPLYLAFWNAKSPERHCKHCGNVNYTNGGHKRDCPYLTPLPLRKEHEHYPYEVPKPPINTTPTTCDRCGETKFREYFVFDSVCGDCY